MHVSAGSLTKPAIGLGMSQYRIHAQTLTEHAIHITVGDEPIPAWSSLAVLGPHIQTECTECISQSYKTFESMNVVRNSGRHERKIEEHVVITTMCTAHQSLTTCTMKCDAHPWPADLMKVLQHCRQVDQLVQLFRLVGLVSDCNAVLQHLLNEFLHGGLTPHRKEGVSPFVLDSLRAFPHRSDADDAHPLPVAWGRRQAQNTRRSASERECLGVFKHKTCHGSYPPRIANARKDAHDKHNDKFFHEKHCNTPPPIRWIPAQNNSKSTSEGTHALELLLSQVAN